MTLLWFKKTVVVHSRLNRLQNVFFLSSADILHCILTLQVLRYFDYVFTGVFTFEMIIKVRRFLSVRQVITTRVYCIITKWSGLYLLLCVTSDDWPGSGPPWRLLLQRPVEHSGFHCCLWRTGGLCTHVSHMIYLCLVWKWCFKNVLYVFLLCLLLLM